MQTCRLVFLIVTVITASQCSDDVESECYDYDPQSFNLLAGESFYFVPFGLPVANVPDDNITWYKNDTLVLSTDEKEKVHYHGGALYFLNLTADDSGSYTARRQTSGKCYIYPLEVRVFRGGPSKNKELLYYNFQRSGTKVDMECPGYVSYTCTQLHGEITWEKDSKHLDGERERDLWIINTKDSRGIYTCVCTWKHHQTVYRSSGSRWHDVTSATPLLVSRVSPVILFPTNHKQIADEGSEMKLDCSGYCGTNVMKDCTPSWLVNGEAVRQGDGYSLNKTDHFNETLKRSVVTETLTIGKVSAKDFRSEFVCLLVGSSEIRNSTLTLKRRDSIIPLVIKLVCVLLVCVCAAMLVKCFAIDLALFFRPFLPLSRCNKDERMYDAYVVYQTQNLDKATEDKLCRFITSVLPSVLEEKCGYRLFIHERDDIPGEDCLERVEDRMKQSRRLMVILTPDSESGSEITDQRTLPQTAVIGGFDWQVGLHHVLVQREMSVILIQLGDTGPKGYTHLPPGLQHLIQKSPPIRWKDGSRGAAASNSRFWKRVRYLMPARPVKKCVESSAVV